MSLFFVFLQSLPSQVLFNNRDKSVVMALGLIPAKTEWMIICIEHPWLHYTMHKENTPFEGRLLKFSVSIRFKGSDSMLRSYDFEKPFITYLRFATRTRSTVGLPSLSVWTVSTVNRSNSGANSVRILSDKVAPLTIARYSMVANS